MTNSDPGRRRRRRSRTSRSCTSAAHRCSSPRRRSSAATIRLRRTAGSARARVTLARAIELASERARAARTRSRPSAPCSSPTARSSAEGVTETGRPARRARRDRRGGRTRERRDAVRDARAVLAPRDDAAVHRSDPRMQASSVSSSAPTTRTPKRPAAPRFCATRGVDVEFVDSFEARALNEAWRTWVAKRRPFVIYKAALTLDGRATVPGRRWVSGEESRRLVHELRAQVDAVAVGGGTARADRPRLDARDVETPKGQPRRLVFSHGPLPDGLDLELRTGPLEDELRALAAEGVQSLLLEGGADARLGVPRGRPRRQACCCSSHRRSRAPGPGLARCATLPAHALASPRNCGGGGRAPRSLCPRTLTSAAPTTSSSPISPTG